MLVQLIIYDQKHKIQVLCNHFFYSSLSLHFHNGSTEQFNSWSYFMNASFNVM